VWIAGVGDHGGGLLVRSYLLEVIRYWLSVIKKGNSGACAR
jgi:hypothetical protein